MPLIVSSLKGDTSDVFNWTWSITLGGTQDLSTLLQMLGELVMLVALARCYFSIN